MNFTDIAFLLVGLNGMLLVTMALIIKPNNTAAFLIFNLFPALFGLVQIIVFSSWIALWITYGN